MNSLVHVASIYKYTVFIYVSFAIYPYYLVRSYINLQHALGETRCFNSTHIITWMYLDEAPYGTKQSLNLDIHDSCIVRAITSYIKAECI